MNSKLDELPNAPVIDDLEARDWVESLEEAMHRRGPHWVRELLRELQMRAQREGVALPVTSRTPYVNTLRASDQPFYPGDRAIERRIKSLVRWNAMAMVVRANRESSGIGGHISTYASSATLYEVGFNHFFRGREHPCGGDNIYFQGHASPGIYGRAFLEGRLPVERLAAFRQELRPGGGLSSYPHPWLMPDFWEYPTVSMGLGPIMAIYNARFMRYQENRGLREPSDAKVWCFVGDGETDEPETRGAIALAAREELDNLIFVINCNLQRLDGPVRGNGKIVQELEAVFRGVGWNVIKVLWGSDWDDLLEQDNSGNLVRRLSEVLDGEYQKYRVEGGSYIREHFWGQHPELAQKVEHLSDDELWHMSLGGHDPRKVFAAYKSATEHRGAPTVILVKTVKGYGLGEAGEGKNVTHQQKKLNQEELMHFRERFEIPIPEEQVADAPFYRPAEDSPEVQYMLERRKALGGFVPQRRTLHTKIEIPASDTFEEFHEGTGDREVSTTMATVRMLAKAAARRDLRPPRGSDRPRRSAHLRHGGAVPPVRHLLERRTALRPGRLPEPALLPGGQGRADPRRGHHRGRFDELVHRRRHGPRPAQGPPTLPFFVFYSMFGFQRIGDLIWAAADSRTRGFLVGATAGRTTLAGEGLQHQDGQSHLLAYPVPNLLAYDPAYAFEIAVIIEEGIRRMFQEDEDVFYYLTVGNENYVQPQMPEGSRQGILDGIYRLREAPREGEVTAHLLGSGSILNESVRAQQILAEQFGVNADVWSVTSYKALREDAISTERWNRLHLDKDRRRSTIERSLQSCDGVFVAASDYMCALPDSVSRYVPGPMVTLGTDGFGRSDDRDDLRDFFEVDARYIAVATLDALSAQGKFDRAKLPDAVRELGISPDKPDPLRS